ncbi:hypothetical protein OE766_13980 [Pararhizobium sp. YC-54]|nr:hypothetical protein [Pararhizobium sp. YC-54]MCV9999360.1 hypothetical protein [Pararhizobium sp. YC-54]
MKRVIGYVVAEKMRPAVIKDNAERDAVLVLGAVLGLIAYGCFMVAVIFP